MLQSRESQRVGYDLATEQQQKSSSTVLPRKGWCIIYSLSLHGANSDYPTNPDVRVLACGSFSPPLSSRSPRSSGWRRSWV